MTPMLGFIADCVTYDQDCWIKKDDVYRMYKDWAAQEGMKFINQKNTFFAELYAMSDGRLKAYQPRVDGKPIAAVKGMKLSSNFRMKDESWWPLTTDQNEDLA